MDQSNINLGYIPSWRQDDYNRMMEDYKAGGKGKGMKPPKPPQPTYPGFTVEGAAAEQMIPTVKVGQTITATITFTVTGIRQRQRESSMSSDGPVGPDDNDTSVELQANNMQIQASAASDDGGEEPMSAGDAMDAYRAKMKGGVSAPPPPDDDDAMPA
jgi:hypothetical protein